MYLLSLLTFFISPYLAAYCSNDSRTDLAWCPGNTLIQCMETGDALKCSGVFSLDETAVLNETKAKTLKTICSSGEFKNLTFYKRSGKKVFRSTNDCRECYSKPEKCTGDYLYCKLNECATFSECNCVTKSGDVAWKDREGQNGDILIERNVSFSLVNTYVEETLPPFYDNNEFQISGGNKRIILDNRKRFSSDPVVHWNQPNIDIFLQDWQNCTAWLDKASMTLQKDFISSSMSLTMDITWIRDPDPIIIRIYRNVDALKVYSSSLPVDPVVRCDIPSHIASSEFRAAFSCLPSMLQGIFIGFWVLIVICFALLVKLVMVMAQNSCNEPMKFNLTMNDMTKTVVLFSMLICCASACDYSLSISSQNLVCTKLSVGVETCRMTLTTLASLPTPGFKLCYDVTDLDSGTRFGQIRITLEESVLTSPLNLRYYTAAWSKIICANKWCPNTAGCGSDDNCNTFQTWTGLKQANADNKLTGICPLFPGVTTCGASCACAGCGCFFCGDSCTYMRWALQPILADQSYSVYDVGSFGRRNKLNICWFQNDVESCSSGYIQNNLAVGFGQNFTLAILGNLEGNTISLPATHVTINSLTGVGSFVNAAPAGTPTKTQWGDVQGTSVMSFTSPTRTSFNFDKDMCSCSPTGSGATCTCSNSAVSAQASLLQPVNATYNNKIFTLSSNQFLVAVDPQPGTTLVQIDAQNVNFTRIVNEVCPVMTFFDYGGVHSSSTAPWVRVMARSTCLPGSCVLYSSTMKLLTPSLVLITEDFPFIIRFESMQSRFEGEICCKAGNNDFCLAVSGNLANPVLDTGDNGTNTGGTPGETVDDWWNGLDTGSKAGFLIGVILGALIVVGLLALMVYLAGIFGWSFPRRANYESVSDEKLTEGDDAEMEEMLESESI